MNEEYKNEKEKAPIASSLLAIVERKGGKGGKLEGGGGLFCHMIKAKRRKKEKGAVPTPCLALRLGRGEGGKGRGNMKAPALSRRSEKKKKEKGIPRWAATMLHIVFMPL